MHFVQMHGTPSGAGGAILKAWFDSDFLINEMVPSADGTQLIATGNRVRVGDEIDKLVSNIAYFRLGAGVHYASDSDGCQLGEDMGIAVLQDLLQRYPYSTGFRFQKRNGQLVNISNAQNLHNDSTKTSGGMRKWSQF
jgi:hypothetical protein